jgi:hypothetical protein
LLRQLDNEVGGVLGILRDCCAVHSLVVIDYSIAEEVARVAIAAKDFGVALQRLEAFPRAWLNKAPLIFGAASMGALVESLVESERWVGEGSDSDDYTGCQWAP